MKSNQNHISSPFLPDLTYVRESELVGKFAKKLSESDTIAKINPNPIGQRPPVQKGYIKSQSIIKSMLQGIYLGDIVLRDIENDPIAQIYYPGQKYHVIDGGHRSRAIRDFLRGKFPAEFNGKMLYFHELPDDVQNYFENTLVLGFVIYDCTNEEAQYIFKIVNTMTPVNDMERIMYNDTSRVAQEIRSRTMYYFEYKNEVHPLFELKLSKGGDRAPIHWQSDVNPRRLWDEFVAICFAKVRGRGNSEAGYEVIEKMVNQDNVFSQQDLKRVDRILDYILGIKVSSGLKFNKDKFAAAQIVLFSLMEESIDFSITDIDSFGKAFIRAHTRLTGKTANEYDDMFDYFVKGYDHKKQKIIRDLELSNAKKYVRTAIRNFANPWQQREVAKMYLKEMKDAIENHVIFRDNKRSVSSKIREELLAKQGHKCAIDGLPLELCDAHYAHDIAWHDDDIRNPIVSENMMVRSKHNRAMGTITLEEYRVVLRSRGEAV